MPSNQMGIAVPLGCLPSKWKNHCRIRNLDLGKSSSRSLVRVPCGVNEPYLTPRLEVWACAREKRSKEGRERDGLTSVKTIKSLVCLALQSCGDWLLDVGPPSRACARKHEAGVMLPRLLLDWPFHRLSWERKRLRKDTSQRLETGKTEQRNGWVAPEESHHLP